MPEILITPDDVSEIKRATIGVHCNNKCSGNGFIIAKNDKKVNFEDCSCVKEFQRQCQLFKANIPKKYWDFSLNILLKKFIKENNTALALIDGYVKQVNLMIEEGVGLYIQGTNGLAKTAIACYILKEFIKNDKDVYFIRMSRLTTLLFDALKNEESYNKLKWIKTKAQVLVVDEIEKDYKVDGDTTFSGVRVGEIFDEIYETKKCLIVTSNIPKKELNKIHSISVVDRLQELVDIPLVGTSYRGVEDKKDIIIKGMKSGH